MRTSLNNIKAIDDYISGNMATGDRLLFEANLILNNNLVNDMQYQQKTYTIIRLYSRQKIKDEIASVHNKFITAPQYKSLMQRITNLFKKH